MDVWAKTLHILWKKARIQIPVSPDNFAWRYANRGYDWSDDKAEKSLLMKGLPSKDSLNDQHCKSGISSPYPQSRNLVEMNTQQTSNTRPLPSVLHINI